VRFGASLVANLMRAAVSALTAIVVARGLGVAGYGNLNFLLSSFTALCTVSDLGTSEAFFTFIARRKRGPRFFVTYFCWLSLQLVLALGLLGLVFPHVWLDALWLGQSRGAILLAFAAGLFTTQLWTGVLRLGEAARATVLVQVANVVRVLLHLTLVAIALFLHRLTVNLVLTFLVGEYALGAVVLTPRLLRMNLAPGGEPEPGWSAIITEFSAFVRPLVAYLGVSFLYVFADRWLLQRFGGSVQQGLFSVGQQFANIALLATAAILNVFWKEVAEAAERNDPVRLERLLRSVSAALYFVGAWICCLLIPYTGLILRWSVGAQYSAGAVCLAMMLLYPVHQSLGQIQGTFFYATSDTGRYATISIITSLASLPLSYLLLASPEAIVPGLGWGAVGLAGKMVGWQIVVVNVQGWFIARHHHWRLHAGFQFCLLGLLLAAFGAKWLAGTILALWGGQADWRVGLLGSLIYVFTTAILCLSRPQWFGLEAEDVRAALHLGRMLKLRMA
jgi:O-antigen/teichoic acid export membrane protein